MLQHKIEHNENDLKKNKHNREIRIQYSDAKNQP